MCSSGREGAALSRLRSPGDEQQSGDPTHTTGAHRAHRRARATARAARHAARSGRPRATSRIWTGCSPTACPCCATTTPRPPPSARSSRSPSASGRRARRPPRTAGLAVRAGPLGLSAQAGRGRAERQGTPRGGPPGADAAERARRPRRLRGGPGARAAANSPCWPGRRPPAPPPSSARRSNSPSATSSPPHEVAAVLGMDPAAARDLLASAACEVERTRAALAVVETGHCPERRPAHRRQPARCSAPPCAANSSGTSTTARAAAAPPSAPTPRPLARHRPSRPPRCPSSRRPRAAAARRDARHAPARARRRRPALRPARLPDGPQGPRRPPRPAARACRHHDRRRHRRRRPGARPVGRLPGRAPTGEGAGRPLGHRAARRDGPGGLDGEAAGGGYENAGNASTRPGPRFAKDGKPDVSVEVISVAGAGRKRRRTPGGRGRQQRRHHARSP